MKELHTGHLYWPTTRVRKAAYPPLVQHTSAEVVIVGGGMSGITCAHSFKEVGLDTILIERGELIGGSTAANTGLLQFCNDIMLIDLADQIGRFPAEQFYKRCKQTVMNLSKLAQSLPEDVGYRSRSSLYYASTEQDLPKLKEEYEALKSCGFNVEFWTADKIAASFPFRKPGAIVTHDDAEINPALFVNGLADVAVRMGLRIYEKTDMTRLEHLADGTYRVHTADGYTIHTEHVVFAVGYEPEELSVRLVKDKATLNRSYVIVTNKLPAADLQQWHGRFMLWETARPYLYLRTTMDGRIIVGGLDEEQGQPGHSKQRLHSIRDALLEQLLALFPNLATKVKPEFEWCATFGESQDNLPFIGEDPNCPNVYYSLGYGGNGSVYSKLASELLRDLIVGKEGAHPVTDIVSLSRASLSDS